MLMYQFGYLLFQLISLPGVSESRFHDHHRDLFPLKTEDGKCGNTTEADTIDTLGHDFHIDGPDIAALDNNHVLAARGDVDMSVNLVTDIAGIQPAVFTEHRSR